MTDTTDWDAEAELEIGRLIQTWLAENPPPPGALFADDLETWAHNLILAGCQRLRRMGEPLYVPEDWLEGP